MNHFKVKYTEKVEDGYLFDYHSKGARAFSKLWTTAEYVIYHIIEVVRPEFDEEDGSPLPAAYHIKFDSPFQFQYRSTILKHITFDRNREYININQNNMFILNSEPFDPTDQSDPAWFDFALGVF
jgi:hypothetical protein